MAGGSEANACHGCAAAKRRCGKETSGCLRCRTRGIECTYPAPKPTRFVLCPGEDTFSVESAMVAYGTTPQSFPAFNSLGCPSTPSRGADFTAVSFGLDLSGLSGNFLENRSPTSWFTAPETWLVRFPDSKPDPASIVGFEHHILPFHRWLLQWIEKGSNPFIHPELYRNRFLRSIQDAYTTLTCYIHRTASNKQSVFRIVEDRAKQLLTEHSAPLDPLEHLARVQALVVYQMIGLYDGNIRLRHIAEGNIPILNGWMRAMVEHAREVVCLGDSITSSSREQGSIGFVPSNTAHCDSILWHTWIVAESIRRTWIVASAIQTIYLIMKTGRVVPCQGGMMFTTRQGVWEAESAPAWEKLCSEVNVGLMQMADANKVFIDAAPENVNEFTKALLQILFGIETLQRWEVRIQD